MSSIVNEVIRTILNFFLQKDFTCTKTQIKRKPINKIKLSKQKTTKATIFQALKLLKEGKMVGFGLICILSAGNLFVKEEKMV